MRNANPAWKPRVKSKPCLSEAFEMKEGTHIISMRRSAFPPNPAAEPCYQQAGDQHACRS